MAEKVLSKGALIAEIIAKVQSRREKENIIPRVTTFRWDGDLAKWVPDALIWEGSGTMHGEAKVLANSLLVTLEGYGAWRELFQLEIDFLVEVSAAISN